MTVTEQACRELVSLPIYPELTDDQLEYGAGHGLGYFEGERGRGRVSVPPARARPRFRNRPLCRFP